jgi:hypothetical protein
MRTRLLMLALLLAARPVWGGVADSPLPVLMAGETTYHLYLVPGVMSLSCFGTYFSCTSLDTSPMRVGVEMFSPFGVVSNNPVATSLVVGPGETKTFGNTTALDFSIDSNVGGAGDNRFSARILSTSKKLMCTAFVSDTCFSPVTFMRQLTIIKGTKQKASN